MGANGNVMHQTASDPVTITLGNISEATANLPFHSASILKALTQLQHGALTITLPDGKSYRFDLRFRSRGRHHAAQLESAAPRPSRRIDRYSRKLHGP